MKKNNSLILNIYIFIFMMGYASGMDILKNFNHNPKQVSFTENIIQLNSSTILKISDDLVKLYRPSINSLKSTIKALPQTENMSQIVVNIVDIDSITTFEKEIQYALAFDESYWLQINGNNIIITSISTIGALHGITTLEQLLKENNGILQQGIVLDWPDHKIRGLHIVLRFVEVVDIKNIINLARQYHFNTLIVQITDYVNLNSIPSTSKSNQLSKMELSDIISYAKGNGLDVIPELKLLGKQYKLLKNSYPHIMYNKDTYDPSHQETYSIIFPIINEIIDLFQPTAIHIGHDEIAGHNDQSINKLLNKNEKMLPPDLFLQDVKIIHNFLKTKNIHTWIWGDMLISHSELPTMPKKQLHGGNLGYAHIRQYIPKEVVICDWHYWGNLTEYPSASLFAMEGFQVLGTTFKNENIIQNFSKYIFDLPKNNKGMIAGTFYHFIKKDWDIVNKIVAVSGCSFWNSN